MNKSIIILSLLPILITYLISFFNFKKLELETLNYIIPTIIYSSLLFILFLELIVIIVNTEKIIPILDHITSSVLSGLTEKK